jgi:hypothetical protein
LIAANCTDMTKTYEQGLSDAAHHLRETANEYERLARELEVHNLEFSRKDTPQTISSRSGLIKKSREKAGLLREQAEEIANSAV